GAVVERARRPEDEDPEADDRDGDPAVKAPDLRVRPWIERPGELPAGAGVRAVALAGARVADVGASAVANDALLHVGLDPVEPLALRAFPRIQAAVVAEARRPVELRAAGGMSRERVEPQRNQRQEQRVAGREQALGGDAAQLAPTGCFGSVTSVKRISSGSSTTSRLTV